MVHCITKIMPIALYLELHGKIFYSMSNFFDISQLFPVYFFILWYQRRNTNIFSKH